MKQQLKVGDVIRRFDVIKDAPYNYVIDRITKTQAITEDGIRFKIDYEIGAFSVKLPHHVALIFPCKGHRYLSYNYYLIDKTKL